MTDPITVAGPLTEGATMAVFLAISVFFLRFWFSLGDRLFLAFSGAFLLLAANRLMVSLCQVSDDAQHYLYLLRLLAFVLIIIGIIDKNRKQRAGRAP